MKRRFWAVPAVGSTEARTSRFVKRTAKRALAALDEHVGEEPERDQRQRDERERPVEPQVLYLRAQRAWICTWTGMRAARSLRVTVIQTWSFVSCLVR